MSTFGTSGFLFSQYIENVKAVLEESFYAAGPYPVIKSVLFAPTAPYEIDAGEFVPSAGETQARINLDPPAVIIDPYELKIDPSYDEYKQERDSPHTSSGQLGIHLFVRALVLVSNNKHRTSHIRVRQLALDVAAVVTEARRFKTVAGMSQVTHIREASLHQYNSHLVGWFVQWQHPLELDTPDYSSEGVRRAMMDDELPPVKNEITDVILKDEIV